MEGSDVRTLIWEKPQHRASEEAHVVLELDRLEAKGVAVGDDPLQYRLDYALYTGEEFVTERLTVTARGNEWARQVELERWPDGVWTIHTAQEGEVDLPDAGGDPDALADALDVDLGLSPLFNSMPVLRHRLHEREGSEEFTMAWISIPDLGIQPLRQRYTSVNVADDERVVRYESLDRRGGVRFSADITFDRDGLVLDYPGIGKRGLPTAEPI